MATRIGLVLDANDTARLSRFWATALGYQEKPVPEGWDSWAAYDAAHGIAPEDAGVALLDPDGNGPSLWIQPVPESKTAKNRLHMDLKAGGPAEVGADERWRRLEAEAERLVAAGATLLRRVNDPDDAFIVLADPEGNELCVV
jgi:hypothetical protein